MHTQNITDNAADVTGITFKCYSSNTSLTVSVSYQIPAANGVPGAPQSVAIPFTVAFDPNGSVRRNPTTPTTLTTSSASAVTRKSLDHPVSSRTSKVPPRTGSW